MSHFKSYESYDNPTVHQRFAHFLIENTTLFRVSHLLIFFFEKFKFVLMKVVLGLRADTHLLINGAHPIYILHFCVSSWMVCLMQTLKPSIVNIFIKMDTVWYYTRYYTRLKHVNILKQPLSRHLLLSREHTPFYFCGATWANTIMNTEVAFKVTFEVIFSMYRRDWSLPQIANSACSYCEIMNGSETW